MELSEDQQKALYSIIENVRSVNIWSYSSETPKVGFEEEKEDEDSKVEALAQKYMSDLKMTRFDALSKAVSEINS
jgi:hypothetical protein